MARKKKTKGDAGNGGDGIMVMTVSLNLILLIFFVYLNSIGVDDDRRVKKALGSLAGTFGLLPEGLHLSEGKKLLVPGAPIVEAEKLGKAERKFRIREGFERIFKEQTFEEEAHVTREGDDLIIHIAQKVMFVSGSATLLPDAERLLSAATEILHKAEFLIRIEGYTDNVPIQTAQYPSNWELSTARATSVLRFLSETENIPVERMIAVGYGETRPLMPNDRPRNREINRRVRIILLEAMS